MGKTRLAGEKAMGGRVAHHRHAPYASWSIASVTVTARARRDKSSFKALVLALIAAATIAFLWQSFATATHLHFAPGTFAASTASAQPTQVAARKQAPGMPIDCPLCHDTAIAGHFVLSSAVSLVVPITVAAWRCVSTVLLPGRRQRSHAWRSRAPPTASA